MSMQITTVYLTREQAVRLKLIAERTKVRQSRLIRDAIDYWLAAREQGRARKLTEEVQRQALDTHDSGSKT